MVNIRKIYAYQVWGFLAIAAFASTCLWIVSLWNRTLDWIPLCFGVISFILLLFCLSMFLLEGRSFILCPAGITSISLFQKNKAIHGNNIHFLFGDSK